MVAAVRPTECQTGFNWAFQPISGPAYQWLIHTLIALLMAKTQITLI